MTELVQVSPDQINPQIDQLRQQLLMAEEARVTTQQDYADLQHRYRELMAEKTMLEVMVTDKNIIMRSDITLWLSARDILKYYKGQWREKMGIRLSHEGIITGYVYED